MYGKFTYIYYKSKPNVGKYSVHGAYILVVWYNIELQKSCLARKVGSGFPPLVNISPLSVRLEVIIPVLKLSISAISVLRIHVTNSTLGAVRFSGTYRPNDNKFRHRPPATSNTKRASAQPPAPKAAKRARAWAMCSRGFLGSTLLVPAAERWLFEGMAEGRSYGLPDRIHRPIDILAYIFWLIFVGHGREIYKYHTWYTWNICVMKSSQKNDKGLYPLFHNQR